MNDRYLHRGYKYEYKYECMWIDASNANLLTFPYLGTKLLFYLTVINLS